MSQITESTKGQIIGLYQAGKSTREIASLLNIGHVTAARWIKRFTETGSVERKTGSGRPYKLTPDEARTVIAASTLDPFMPSREIQEILQYDVTPRTIINTLGEGGLRCHRAARKPFLTSAQKMERQNFCLSQLNWSQQQWDRVVFTDESCLQTFNFHSRNVYRPINERFNLDYISATKRSGRISVSVWSCLSSKGLGVLHKIPGHLTGAGYVDILEHVMLPEVLDHHFTDGYFFMQQDNSSIHSSRIVKTWFEDNFIQVLEWPRNSADLNPIENAWGLWKKKINVENVTSVDDLFDRATLCWEEIRRDNIYVTNLINSMPQRMRLCLAKNGGQIKY